MLDLNTNILVHAMVSNVIQNIDMVMTIPVKEKEVQVQRCSWTGIQWAFMDLGNGEYQFDFHLASAGLPDLAFNVRRDKIGDLEKDPSLVPYLEPIDANLVVESIKRLSGEKGCQWIDKLFLIRDFELLINLHPKLSMCSYSRHLDYEGVRYDQERVDARVKFGALAFYTLTNNLDRWVESGLFKLTEENKRVTLLSYSPLPDIHMDVRLVKQKEQVVLRVECPTFIGKVQHFPLPADRKLRKSMLHHLGRGILASVRFKETSVYSVLKELNELYMNTGFDGGNFLKTNTGDIRFEFSKAVFPMIREGHGCTFTNHH